MKSITVEKVYKKFKLSLLSGEKGLSKMIHEDDIHSPGLELTGFLEYFPNERIQLLGKQEITYLNTLKQEERIKCFEKILQLNPPCIIITRNQEICSSIIDLCEKYNIALLRTEEKTTNFIALLSNFLSRELAEEMSIHAVCVNVYGIGVILLGKSGVGKSETALTLVTKGHRLVSDDITVIKKISPNTIVGTHHNVNSDFLALRGVGLVNVPRLFGTSSVQDETRIVLEIELVEWNDNTYYDSMGVDITYSEYLGVKVKKIIIPVSPGRDVATLIEVAVNNFKLQEKGYNAFDAFQQRINDQM